MTRFICLSLIAVGLVSFNLPAAGYSSRTGPVPFIPIDGTYDSSGRDDTVRMVQLALLRHGYYVALTTGEFGFDTRRAVRRYRRDHGLPVIGKIDDELLRSLQLR